MRLQIAFEYLIVFVFVLLIFTLLLISLAKQLTQFYSQQLFAQLQIAAQTVSTDIAIAGSAGSGYSGSIQLPSELSILQYNISVTKFGVVIASSSVSGQRVQAVASSGRYLVFSNSSYLDPTNTYYIIPTYNGSGYLNLQNTLGIICIDYDCPVPTNQVAQVSLSSQSWHALLLNGQNDYAQAPAIQPLSQSVITMSGWVYINGPPANYWNWMISQYGAYGVGACGNTYIVCYYDWGAGKEYDSTFFSLQPKTWYLLTAVVSGGDETVFVDGNEVLSGTITPSPTSLNAFQIGNGNVVAQNEYLNGAVSNIQIYADPLTKTQIDQLFYDGIGGPPLQDAGLLTWWPLNGNGDDYSGNYIDLTFYGQSSFPSVVQLNAQTTNQTANSINGALVGFSSSLGGFSKGASTYNISNPSGDSSAILTQGRNTGIATVKATAFNGNSSLSANLVGWWPLNEGQGTVAGDLSPETSSEAYLSGNIMGAWWASPNYVASFDGQSGLLEVPNSVAFTADIGSGASMGAMTGWFKITGPSTTGYTWLLGQEGVEGIGVCGTQQVLCFLYYANPGGHLTAITSNTPIPLNTWFMLSMNRCTGCGTGTPTEPGWYIDGFRVLYSSFNPVSLQTSMSIGGQISYNGNSTHFLNGSASNIQVYAQSLSQTQFANLYSEGMGGPPLIGANVLAWWPLDGDTLDYSGNGNNATAFGNFNPVPFAAPQQYPTATFLAGVFNGANSVIASNNTIFNTPSTTQTVSAWVEFGGTPGDGDPGSFFGRNGGITAGACTTNLYVCFTSASGAVQSPSAILTPNTWYLMTSVFNSTSGIDTLYVDGANIISGTASTGASYATSNFMIGQNGAGGAFMKGNITNVQVYSAALSQQQVLQMYGNGTDDLPIQGGGLISWFPLYGNTSDYSSYSDSDTATGLAYSQQHILAPHLTASSLQSGLYFNGEGNVVIANPVPFPTTNALTVSAWIFPVSKLPSGKQVVVGQNGRYTLSIANTISQQVGFSACIGGSNPQALTPSGIQLNGWYMLTGVYNGTDLSVYVNGVPVNEVRATGNICSSANPTVIGASPTGSFTTSNFNGTIADVQVYSIGLNPVQVGQLYNSGIPASQSISVPMGGAS